MNYPVFNKLKSLFAETTATDSAPAFDPVALAACVLMIEAAAAEDGISDKEWQKITSLMRDSFKLDQVAIETLMAHAKALHDDSVQLLRFTQVLKDEIPFEERGAILELLWEIVLADDEISPLEDTLIRRIAGLLYVDDVARGAARRRVLARKEQK